jgi:hypothetical protein
MKTWIGGCNQLSFDDNNDDMKFSWHDVWYNSCDLISRAPCTLI